MNKFIANSLNKKLILITVLVLVFGIFFKAIHSEQNELSGSGVRGIKTEHVYAGSNENASDISNEAELIEMKYLSLKEYEEYLEEKYITENYIDPDPNFEEKVEKIKTYLKTRNSPLVEKAEYIIIMANKFEIDYRLVPAISIIESSGGTRLYRPYNAWGWGGAKGFTFENWEESIYTVTRGISRGYYARGLVTPQEIAPRYNPHTPNEWGAKVDLVMKKIGPEL